MMIKTFRHKGLQLFFETGKKSGIQAAHANKLGRQLSRLHVAKKWGDMNIPGWGLHLLKDKPKDHYSISVNENWRMTFKFEGEDVVLVDYQDYH
jgi:proteic killer suppression protein